MLARLIECPPCAAEGRLGGERVQPIVLLKMRRLFDFCIIPAACIFCKKIRSRLT